MASGRVPTTQTILFGISENALPPWSTGRHLASANGRESAAGRNSPPGSVGVPRLPPLSTIANSPNCGQLRILDQLEVDEAGIQQWVQHPVGKGLVLEDVTVDARMALGDSLSQPFQVELARRIVLASDICLVVIQRGLEAVHG